MMTYLFQGWNCRGPAKYRDMIMDIGTEEIGHVEMLATMIARLLETSPVETREEMAKDSAIGAILGGARIEDAIVAGMNPQHVIVTGSGAAPTDSVGYPWTARYTIASGNLLADFRFNVTAESQGRLQVSRLYQLTDDPGVRDMLSFLLARDTMHQNQWLAAIKELEEEGLEMTPYCSRDTVSLTWWIPRRWWSTTPSTRLNRPKPISKLPTRSLLDQRMWLRRDARDRTIRPSTTKMYVVAWKSPSQADRIKARHAGPLVVVDDQHAVFVVLGAETSGQLRASPQPQGHVDGVETDNTAARRQPGADALGFSHEFGDGLVHEIDVAGTSYKARRSRPSAAS
jgi:Manganese containing catalase